MNTLRIQTNSIRPAASIWSRRWPKYGRRSTLPAPHDEQPPPLLQVVQPPPAVWPQSGLSHLLCSCSSGTIGVAKFSRRMVKLNCGSNAWKSLSESAARPTNCTIACWPSKRRSTSRISSAKSASWAEVRAASKSCCSSNARSARCASSAPIGAAQQLTRGRRAKKACLPKRGGAKHRADLDAANGLDDDALAAPQLDGFGCGENTHYAALAMADDKLIRERSQRIAALIRGLDLDGHVSPSVSRIT